MLILILTLTLLFSPPSAFANSSPCLANSASTLTTCINDLVSQKTPAIEITSSFTCDATSPCSFTVKSATSGQIYGTAGANITITRRSSYAKPILQIIDSHDLTISNLIFDDDSTIPMCIYPSSDCVAQVGIVRSQNIAFTNVSLLNSKAQAITLNTGKDFTLKNSHLAGTFLQGIWMPVKGKQPSASLQDGLLITGNRFKDIYGAALFLSGHRIVVKNNYFDHNQWNPPWEVQGGQVHFTGTDGLDFIGNIVINGKYDTKHPQYSTHGLEVSKTPQNSNIVVRHNQITGNSGWGVVANDDHQIISMLVEKNQITGNLKSPQIHDLSGVNKWTVRDNGCTPSTCSFPAQGTLSITPNPCYIRSGQSTCSAELTWRTNFVAEIAVKSASNTLSTAKNGKQVISDITTATRTIQLTNNGQVIDTVSITAVPTDSSTTPPPPPTQVAGDFNGDSKVDLLDYNLLVSQFSNPYTLLDYNLLVANFGK